MASSILGQVLVEGRCSKCRRGVTIQVSLSPPVSINTGGFFHRCYKLFMPVYLKPEDRKCPHCGHIYFEEVDFSTLEKKGP